VHSDADRIAVANADIHTDTDSNAVSNADVYSVTHACHYGVADGYFDPDAIIMAGQAGYALLCEVRRCSDNRRG
ncbi:MAG: hypothetical protein QF368_13430, partial [SAR202 cluster bacterium]|nr:hypothetical protein [SAR202 cluster bacterium]